jgi:type I restriction enzyme, S subunit
MKYGLSEKQLEQIVDFIAEYPEVESAVLFGSRALGTYKEASDVDIALHGEKVNHSLAAKMKFNIEEDTYLPFMFDFVAYPTITNDALRKHIDMKGVVIFRREESNWKEGVLGDVINFGNGKSRPKTEGTYPVYGGNGILGYATEFNYDGQTIVIGRVGAYCGATYFENQPIWVSDNALAAKPKNRNDAKYLYYLLKDLNLNQHAEGSSHPLVTQRLLNAIDVTYSDDECEQKAIASVLSSLDDKIDLLHRQNKTLEAMAETLFRQWFVEEAQEGWEEVRLSDLCSVITKGTTPTTLGHKFVDTGVNFVKAESITDEGNFLVVKFARISEETHAFLSRSILQSGDVLCSIAGTIGRIAIVDHAILPANTNQAIAILRVNSDKCIAEFVYLFLKSAAFREVMEGKIVHAVQPNLSLGEIGSTTLQRPSNEALNRFETVIQPIFEKKKHNTRNIHTLEKLRDTLLPKLMSGEVRVNV